MKIVIVGPGAIGCLFAAFFTKKKQAEVWVLDKSSPRAKRIKDSGVKVQGIGGNFKIKVNITASCDDIKTCDLIMLCVKSYDTEAAVKSIKPLLGKDTNVLTLQNGLGNVEMIAEVIGQDKVLAGVTSHGATLGEEASTYHAGTGETIIGRIDGQLTVPMRQVREIFNKSGFSTRLSKDINSVIWSKLIINTGINALTALTRFKNGAMIQNQLLQEILGLAVTEAVKVAKKKRIKLMYDDPIQKVESVCRATADNVSSMLQDILKQKRTEIDYINGAIVRQAKSLGIPSPTNLILTDLVRSIEQAYDKQLK
ncbi:MAG: 2-dehydropantoate 2-reductase [Candidatus Omnitrophota bacterium]